MTPVGDAGLSGHDFTEAHYADILAAAAARYRFVPFTAFDAPGNICLWRHDVDFSPHRARRLAAIEAAAGVAATYFVNVHSEFYNALESDVARIVGEIVGLGHHLGLHFDAGFYGPAPADGAERDGVLARERDLLEAAFGVPVRCYSVHNPGVVPSWHSDDTAHAGMINAYCGAIAARFTYVSDSNGIWRHRRLADVIAEAPAALHVLTHPGWWTPTAMSPRARISRCIDGRARATHERYDQFLAAAGRPNVGRDGR